MCLDASFALLGIGTAHGFVGIRIRSPNIISWMELKMPNVQIKTD